MVAPVIEPFFFGSQTQPLFGTFHPSADGRGRVLTVICPPLFSEYMRVHFALRELAVALSERGHDVLRLDYAGTGDSFGDLEEVSVTDWIGNIKLAVAEGLDLSASSTVRIAGVRAGALLACKALGGAREVDRFVLWDPVSDGGGYLAALRKVQRTMLGRTLVGPADRAEAEREFAGYRLSGAMVEQIETLKADVYGSIANDRLFVVETSGTGPVPVRAGDQRHVAYACDWETESEDQLLPRPVLEQMISCLTAP